MPAKVLNRKDYLVINKWLLGWHMINKRESDQIVEFESQSSWISFCLYQWSLSRERERKRKNIRETKIFKELAHMNVRLESQAGFLCYRYWGRTPPSLRNLGLLRVTNWANSIVSQLTGEAV